MDINFRKRFRKALLALLALFAVLFVFRIIYGYNKTSSNQGDGEALYFQTVSSVKRNFASKEYRMKSEQVAGQASVVTVDQKYEKIAEVSSKSAKFSEEEKLVRTNIDDNNAIIQFEQKSGNDGSRRLYLQIGVPPENFDTLYSNLIKIGKVHSKQITKKDKTNEYKELNAKKASLEKTLHSLVELKSKGGKIEEYVELENRILNIEEQLQELGVNLGDFDDENEFCTVQFSLAEGKEVKISFIHRLKVALEWTVKIYLQLVVALFFVAICAYLFLLIADKLKVFEKLLKKME